MCICFCMHPYECMHYTLCSMHYAYIMQYALCIHYAVCNQHIQLWLSKLINDISWLFPSKMTPYKAQCSFVFVCIQWVQTLCIMQLTYCILYVAFCLRKFINNIGWLSHRKWHPTRNSVHHFFASLWVRTLCIKH